MVCAVAWADDSHHHLHHMSTPSGCPSNTVSSSGVITTTSAGGTGPSQSSGSSVRDQSQFTGISSNQPCMLYTAGFDRRVYGWEVSAAKEKE